MRGSRANEGVRPTRRHTVRVYGDLCEELDRAAELNNLSVPALIVAILYEWPGEVPPNPRRNAKCPNP